jgi:hypothetical protein
LPTHKYRLPFKLGHICLNPGPFNPKEHTLISVAVNTGGMAAYASDIIAVQKLFFDLHLPVWMNLLLLLTTQFMGYSLAGYLKGFLVRPVAMIWPTLLVQVTLYNTLHSQRNASTKNHGSFDNSDANLLARANSFESGVKQSRYGSSRQRFFLIVFCAVFAYHLLPLTVLPVLTSLSIICLVLPQNGFAQLLGSGMRGFGLGTLSFDWTAVGSFAPLHAPWWAQVNFFMGAIGVLWVLAPLIWYFDI